MEGGSPLPSGWRRWDLDRHPSSNAAALEAARNGDPGRLCISTVEQTAGRGRRGREWVSSRGNLHASLLLVDPAPAEVTPTISYVAGVALVAALTEAAGPAAAGAIRLKWPNDLLCTGRKVAGILVEGADLGGGRRAVVIGFGVNCVAHPGLGEGYSSGDLASLGVPVEAEPLFFRLTSKMAEWLAEWDEGRGFAAVRTQWMSRSVGLGQPVKARLPDRLVEGRFEDLDAMGRLVLTRLDGKREAISAGDVFFRNERELSFGYAPDLVFLPLGGVGEIGMRVSLYGFGPPKARKWLAVDFGIAFPGPELPGVDAILPDIAFLQSERRNLLGIVLTHAHEDHFGALLDLWPRLGVPVYATPFAAALIEAKCREEPGAPKIPVTIVKVGSRFTLGPFDIEMVAVAHSIPEPTALAIRTELGLVVHSGDWRIDLKPSFGQATDVDRLKELGREGVLALICNSTNAMREGRSPGEAEVAAELTAIIREAPERVVFTTFASNVIRLRSIAEAAAENGRDVVIVGRSLRRVVDVAGELGMLNGLRPFYEADAFGYLPRSKVVAIVTGSQGEPRAVLSRLAEGDHRDLALSDGDTVVFSSRTIPGNEKPVNQIINSLVSEGIKVITDRDRLVHASGHPRRGELADLYGWLSPQILLPVHGEPMHLGAQASFAREMGIAKVMVTRNGKMVRLAPNPSAGVDEVPAGRLYRDGRLVGRIDELRIAERRRLSIAGHVALSVVLDSRGEVVADIEVELTGLPTITPSGIGFADLVLKATSGALSSIPRTRRRDAEMVREALRRAARAAVEEVWGKKPVCTVLVSVI